MSEDDRVELDPSLEEMEIDFRSRQQSGNVPADDELVTRLAEWEQRYA
jgi:hypothetical protein